MSTDVAVDRGRSVSPANPTWLSGRKARERLGISAYSLLRLAVVGEVKTENRPGRPTRYASADVERLALAKQITESPP